MIIHIQIKISIAVFASVVFVFLQHNNLIISLLKFIRIGKNSNDLSWRRATILLWNKSKNTRNDNVTK